MSWKRNEKLQEMYKVYTQGYSLEQVGKIYGRTRQSVYGLFQHNGLSMRQRKPPLPFVLFQNKKYTLRNTGYYGKTSKGRTLLHRDIWEHHYGDIPAGYDVHHKDENKTNNTLNNFECLPKAEHTRKYSPHNNQYTKGRKRS